MPSTITIQSIVNLTSTFAELMPLSGVGGFTNEPGLSIANDTMQELLGEKMPWKCNRKEMASLFTTQGKQDYLFAGACAFTTDNAKGVGIDLASANAITESGNTVTVNTLDNHALAVGDTVYMTGNTVAAYNSTFTQTTTSSVWSGGWTVVSTPTTKSFTFTHASSGLGTSGAPGISDFGWLEGGTMVDPGDVNSPQSVRGLSAVRNLQPAGLVTNPSKVCLVSDLQTGVLKIRFYPLPGLRWQVSLVYQAKAPLLASLASTWSPFPDELSYVYRQMFLAQAFKFANSARSEVEYAKAQAAIAKGLGRDDRELSDEYMVPDDPITTNGSGGFNYGWWF